MDISDQPEIKRDLEARGHVFSNRTDRGDPVFDANRPVSPGYKVAGGVGLVFFCFLGLLALGAICALALKIFHWVF